METLAEFLSRHEKNLRASARSASVALERLRRELLQHRERPNEPFRTDDPTVVEWFNRVRTPVARMLAFAQTLDDERPTLIRIAQRFKLSVDDLRQDVFLRFADNLPRFRSEAHRRNWLRRVARNRAIDLGRRAGRNVQPETGHMGLVIDPHSRPSDIAVRRVYEERVNAELDSTERRAFDLLKDGADVAEVAEKSGRSQATVYRWLARIKKLLGGS